MGESNYKVQGFLQEKRERQKQVLNARNLKGTFRGYKLDEIELQVTIKNQKELDEFIMFLQESRPCFNVNTKTDVNNVSAETFSFNEAVVWDSHFGYEIGYFLGEGHVYETYLIDVRTGVVHSPTCYPKLEIHKYSNELIDKLTKKYGYEKRLKDIL